MQAITLAGDWDERGEPGLPAVQRLIHRWADAVPALGDAQDKVFLPLSLHDQCVEGFLATRQGERIVLRGVVVEGIGASLDLGDMDVFMRREHTFLDEYPMPFGEYDRMGLIRGLQQAITVTD